MLTPIREAAVISHGQLFFLVWTTVFLLTKVSCDRKVFSTVVRIFFSAKAGKILMVNPCTALPQTPLEKLEKLEQLRAIENGFAILVGKVEHTCEGIDTPEQYAAFVKRTLRHTEE